MTRIIALALLALPQFSLAHEYKAGDLFVDHPVAFETPVTAMAGAGYLVITNTGDTDDRLIAVSADFPRVMIHDTKIENDIASMVHLDGIDIPAGETVTLEPGGMHVMFMGLNGDPLEVGETIEATLTFEKAGEVDVVFNVEARDPHGAKSETDHSGH